MRTHIEKHQFDWESSQLPCDVDPGYKSSLPRRNLIVHLIPNLQWRLALSKAISRPDVSGMHLKLSLNVSHAKCADPPYTGSAGHSHCKPITAKPYGTSLEWYYGRGSLLYGALFYKNVTGFITRHAFNDGL